MELKLQQNYAMSGANVEQTAAKKKIKLDPDIEFLIMDFSLNCTIYT